MKIRLIPAALLAVAALSATSAVQAQNRGDRDDHNDRNGRHEQRDDRRDDARHDNRHDNGPRYDTSRRNDRVDYRDHGNDRRYEHRGDRGAGPRHDLRKGGRLPSDYRNRQYVVDDWRGHRLSSPPRGYHWVQTGNDYVLAAIATGVIASIILGN